MRLAIEVHFRGPMGTDRVAKCAEYAAAGISDYWMVDLRAPITLTAYSLTDSDYRLRARCSGKSVIP